jgi:hypothetical protein
MQNSAFQGYKNKKYEQDVKADTYIQPSIKAPVDGSKKWDVIGHNYDTRGLGVGDEHILPLENIICFLSFRQ